jgi:nucleoside-diphosphate-sugar epimerase
MNICITGVSGNIGRYIALALSSEQLFENIYGIDVAVPSGSPSHIEFNHLDVVRDDLSGVFEKSDVVLHLAFQVGPTKDPAKAQQTNIHGTKRVISYFNQSPTSRLLLFLSSASVYGLHPDNKIPLSETDSVRPDIARVYQKSKFVCEGLIMSAVRKDKYWIVLRPSLVFGHQFDNFLLGFLKARWLVKLRHYAPVFQLLHIEDLCLAIKTCISHTGKNLYNVAPDDYVSIPQCAKIMNKRILNIPLPFVKFFVLFLNKVGLQSFNTKDLDFWKYSIVLDNARIRDDIGWQANYSTRQIIGSIS